MDLMVTLNVVFQIIFITRNCPIGFRAKSLRKLCVAGGFDCVNPFISPIGGAGPEGQTNEPRCVRLGRECPLGLPLITSAVATPGRGNLGNRQRTGIRVSRGENRGSDERIRCTNFPKTSHSNNRQSIKGSPSDPIVHSLWLIEGKI